MCGIEQDRRSEGDQVRTKAEYDQDDSREVAADGQVQKEKSEVHSQGKEH